MKLFSGTACFSPSVSSAVKCAWSTHGGKIAATLKEKQYSQWFFCSGMDDPWLAELSTRPIIVFHMNWILSAVSSRFVLPLGEYVLDARYKKPDKEALVGQVQGSHHTGNLQENSGIIKFPYNSNSTRLACPADPVLLRKRPRMSSPEDEHDLGLENRAIKKAKLILQRSQLNSGIQISPGTPTQESAHSVYSLSTYSASDKASAAAKFNNTSSSSTSSPFSADALTALGLTLGLSDTQNDDIPGFVISDKNKGDHDQIQLEEKQERCGQLRGIKAEPGSPSSASYHLPLPLQLAPSDYDSGSDGMPPSMTPNIWLSLLRDAEHDSNNKSFAEDISASKMPIANIAEVLKVLAGTNMDGVALFAVGRVHRGRRFRVDAANRRKTV